MAEATRPPNILVFFCDQLRLDLLGCYGVQSVRTPNLDALAGESVVFERAYTPTALCSPARASLMTGLYPHAHHMFNNSTPGYSYCEHLRADLDTLPGWADAETNYETAYFGKWHIGPAQDLFESAFHHTHPQPFDGGPPFLASSHWHPSPALGEVGVSLAGGKAGTLRIPMDAFPDAAAASYTRQFLRAREGGRPFLACCAFPGPHSPWFVPDEFGIRYDPAQIPMWANRHDRFAGKPVAQKKLRLQELARHGTDYQAQADGELRELLAGLFSYVELIDTLVGEVLTDLRDSGLAEETTVVFTADHGDMAGAHGFLSKGSYMYDEIYRIPLIVRPAGESAPRRVAAPVHLMDVTATIMQQMAGRPVTAMRTHELHGRSLEALMAGADECARRLHYAEYHGDWYGHYSARMVTDGRWKLVWNLMDHCELYDLESDPGELRNLFYDPAYRAVRDEYFAALREEALRLGDRQVRLLPEVEAWLPGGLDDELRASDWTSCSPKGS